MENTDQRFSKGFAPAGRLVFALIGHIVDPDTGERLIDDPNFRAAAGIKDDPRKKSA